MSTATAILATLRPRQWAKNLFVAAPLVFSKHLFDADRALRAGLAIAVFCALSGAVYAFNDVRDVEGDRLHPTKRRRPIAAGELGISAALALAGVLAALALAGGLALEPRFAAIAAAYLVNNLAYSLYLKRLAFLDVGLIALGFLLRVVGGAFAIDVPISPWLLACSTRLASLLGFGKRAHELALAVAFDGVPPGTRAALAGYSLRALRVLLAVLSLATSAAYALYTQDHRTVAFFGTRHLVFTLPFCVLGIARFIQLAIYRPREEPPTDAILRDPLFLLNMLGWAATVLLIIYGSR